MELLEETVKLPQLCVSPEDFMNPDTTVGGFPAFLGLVQQVQCTLVISAMIHVEREQVEKYRFIRVIFFSP